MTKGIMARRIALLSSSSLGLAAIVSAASIGVALAPATALAQTATCTSGTAVNNNGTGAVTIAGGNPNNPGITCLYTGDTATVTTLGSTTVSTTAPGGGVNLTAAGTNDINWTSTAGTVTGGAQTNGPVIDAQTSGAGNINLTTGAVTPNATSGSDGIFARSLGAGNITLITGAVGFGNVAGSTAIEAISAGGNISITTSGQVGTNANTLIQATTNRDGIVVQTSSAGEVNLNLGGLTKGFGAGGAAIRVTNGAGDVHIQTTGEIRGGESANASDAQLGSALVIDSDGDVEVESTSIIIGAVNNTGPQPAAIVASGQTFTLTLTGDANTGADQVHVYRASLGGTYSSPLTQLSYTGEIALDVAGVGITNRLSGGHLDLSGVTVGAELNFNSRARWVLTGDSLMSPGADTVNLDATSAIITAMMGVPTRFDGAILEDVDQEIIRPGIVDFGAGEDVMNSQGRIFIGPVYSSDTYVGEGLDLPAVAEKRLGMRGEARLLNLEQFNNSGGIWLGARFNFFDGATFAGTDLWHDDMLYMPGATFHGGDDSVVYLDVDVNKSQSSCAPSTRDSQGYLPAADCIGLQGGAATGRTELRIFEQVPGDRGQYNPGGIVLIDLAGGDPDDTESDAFFIGPDTPRYIDLGDNGAIEKGVFVYALGFDADAQQFKLFGIPSSGAQQFPILATAANQLWHTATGGWFDRRVNQRDVEGSGGLGTGAWLNITGVGVQRDIATTIALGTGEAEFDNSYEQSDVTISFGWDLLDYGSNAALGVMVGYAHSEIEFDDSANGANLEGIHGGVYGGYAVGGFFVDAAVNASVLSLHNDVPAMNLQPVGTVLDTEVRSLGGRVEAGWRWDAGYGLSIEPLVGFSAVASDFEDMRVPNDDPDATRPGVTVKLDNAQSRRASAGLRVSMQDLWTDVAPTSFSLTARAVNEFEGAANVSVANIGPTFLSTDNLDGMFTQVTGSMGVSNVAKTISGYLNVESVTGDDYESLGASLGVRLHW